MTTNTNIESANEFASIYDEYVMNCQWVGVDILFGLMFKYLQPNQKILDIGIGTGLSAFPFKKYGLNIFGIDGSSNMIDICRDKGITDNLELVDFTKKRSWFESTSFDHIISHAVFHLIGDLEFIFKQSSTILNDNGYFGFTYERKSKEKDGYRKTPFDGVYENINLKSGIKSYQHSERYINEQLKKNGFKVVKKTEFLAFFDSKSNVKKFFNIIIANKL